MGWPFTHRSQIALVVTLFVVIASLMTIRYLSFGAADQHDQESLDQLTKQTQKIFVNKCSPNANDTNSGESWLSPLKTINAALEKIPLDNKELNFQILIGATNENCLAYEENLSISRKSRFALYGGMSGEEVSFQDKKGDGKTFIIISQPIALTAVDFATIDSIGLVDRTDLSGALNIDSSKNIMLKNILLKNLSLRPSQVNASAMIKSLDSSVAFEALNIENNFLNSSSLFYSQNSQITLKDSLVQRNNSAISTLYHQQKGFLIVEKCQFLSNNFTEILKLNNLEVGSRIEKSFFYGNNTNSLAELDGSQVQFNNSIFADNRGSVFKARKGRWQLYNLTLSQNGALAQPILEIDEGEVQIANLLLDMIVNQTVIKTNSSRFLKRLETIAYTKGGRLGDDEVYALCKNCREIEQRDIGFKGGNRFLDHYYQLTADSSLLGKGVELTTIIDDYFGSARVSVNDIGAVQLKR